MPSIIVSSDSPAIGRQIAKGAAEKMGYNYLGHEFLEQVATRHDVRENDLSRALEAHGARLGVLNRTRQLNLSYIQAAVLEQFLNSNVVCEGLAAHLYLRDVPHVMNIRVLDDTRMVINRIAAEKGLSPGRVRRRLERQEQRQRRWSLEVFGIDELNPANYDMVISLGQIEIERVIKTICDTISDPRFHEMTYSRKCVEDWMLKYRVKTVLVKNHPTVQIETRDGNVMLGLGRSTPGWRKRAAKIKILVQEVDGVDYVEIHKALPDKTSEGLMEERTSWIPKASTDRK